MSLTTNLSSNRANARRRGVAALEFALTLPLWLLLFLGGTDLTFMMLLSQRTDRIAYSVADIMSQSSVPVQDDIDKTFLAGAQLMEPFSFSPKGVIILTSIQKPVGQPLKICWQQAGGGALARESKIGTPGETPVLPGGLTLNDNEDIIIAEVFYAYEPLFLEAGPLKAGDLYRVAIYKPRLSCLCTNIIP